MRVTWLKMAKFKLALECMNFTKDLWEGNLADFQVVQEYIISPEQSPGGTSVRKFKKLSKGVYKTSLEFFL